MFVSVIIPIHKRKDLFDKCIEGIRSSASGDYEIIVIDDFSNPPIQIGDQNLKLIVSKSNIGPAGARNLGAKAAKGDLFLFIDSDVVLSKEAYRKIIETFWESSVDAVHGIYTVNSPYNNFFSNYKNLYWNFNQLRMNPLSYSICTAIFAIRKDVFNEMGGFNPTSLIGEDKELALKLREKNKKLFQNKEAQGMHYKKFNLSQLFKYHLQNSVACALLFLKTKKNGHPGNETAWAGKNQLIGMILSFLAVFLCLLFIFTFEPVFLISGAILLALFLYRAVDFLKYSYKHSGIKFSFFCFLMRLAEEFIGALGIGLGIFRFFLLRHKNLDFKIGI